MRLMFKKAAILGGLSVSLLSTTAYAGGCVQGPVGPICNPSVVTHPGTAPSIDPVHVYAQRPMGHLRSIQYLGSPSVNITRVHGVQGAPALSDAPTGFTGGCTPESHTYCNATGMHVPAPAPVIAAPAPVIAAPAPQVTERVVAIGGGYDPSKFIPRTYGSNELTPGIAHIPTSIVDRSPENAQAVLNSGMTQPQPIVSGGIAPRPSMVGSASMAAPVVSTGTIMPAAPMHGNVIGHMNRMVTMAPETNVYPGSMAGDGTYYEKVSYLVRPCSAVFKPRRSSASARRLGSMFRHRLSASQHLFAKQSRFTVSILMVMFLTAATVIASENLAPPVSVAIATIATDTRKTGPLCAGIFRFRGEFA